MHVLQILLDGVRAARAGFPDKRRGGVAVASMSDTGLSAFSLFFMQSESFLSRQRGLGEGRKASNCQSLFGRQAVPTGAHVRAHVRARLDPVDPAHPRPAFDGALDALRRHGTLLPAKAWLLPVPGPQARQRPDRELPSMLAAPLAAPGHAMALPLVPEFIAPQGGAGKPGCERNAAKRWLASHAGRVRGRRRFPGRRPR